MRTSLGIAAAIGAALPAQLDILPPDAPWWVKGLVVVVSPALLWVTGWGANLWASIKSERKLARARRLRKEADELRRQAALDEQTDPNLARRRRLEASEVELAAEDEEISGAGLARATRRLPGRGEM